MWNVDTFECVTNAETDSRIIFSLIQLQDGTLVSGGWDKCLSIWDVFSFRWIGLVETICSKVISLIHDDNGLLGSLIEKWDIWYLTIIDYY